MKGGNLKWSKYIPFSQRHLEPVPILLVRISHQHVGWVKQTVSLVGLRSRTRTSLKYNVYLE
jgi:hypothetical protein